MKVLHLIDSGGLYGAEKMLLSLVKEQLSQGMEPMILSAGEPHIEEKAIEAEARRMALPILSWRMKPGLNLIESWRIVKWARNNGFQILHSHGYKFNVLVGAFPLWLRKVPLVSTLHGYVHAKALTKAWIYEHIDRWAIRRMQGVVVVSKAMENEVPRSQLRKRNFAVIHNGIDVRRVKEMSQQPLSGIDKSFLDSHNPILLGIGRLSPEKGFERAIDLLTHLRKQGYPNAGLVIIGEGRLRSELESRADEAGIGEDVLLPGYCTNAPALMGESDLYVISSYTEGLPISLLEAMAVGVPVLASPVGEIPEVIGLYRDKVLTDFQDVQTVTTQAGEILGNESNGREITEALGKRVSDQYSVLTMASRYKEFYQQVLRIGAFNKGSSLGKEA